MAAVEPTPAAGPVTATRADLPPSPVLETPLEMAKRLLVPVAVIDRPWRDAGAVHLGPARAEALAGSSVPLASVPVTSAASRLWALMQQSAIESRRGKVSTLQIRSRPAGSRMSASTFHRPRAIKTPLDPEMIRGSWHGAGRRGALPRFGRCLSAPFGTGRGGIYLKPTPGQYRKLRP